MGVAAVPVSKHVCIFCERQLLINTFEEGFFLILCGGCRKEMIDCNCSSFQQGHQRDY